MRSTQIEAAARSTLPSDGALLVANAAAVAVDVRFLSECLAMRRRACEALCSGRALKGFKKMAVDDDGDGVTFTLTEQREIVVAFEKHYAGDDEPACAWLLTCSSKKSKPDAQLTAAVEALLATRAGWTLATLRDQLVASL